MLNIDGNVGCIVNGAGLAMTTMDIIKLSGGKPANFLDIGGTADLNRVKKAIRLLIKNENISVILLIYLEELFVVTLSLRELV